MLTQDIEHTIKWGNQHKCFCVDRNESDHSQGNGEAKKLKEIRGRDVREQSENEQHVFFPSAGNIFHIKAESGNNLRVPPGTQEL